MKLAVSLALKGLRSDRGFALTAIANIALGVLGYLVVEGFNDSFLAEVRARSQAIAAADLIASSRTKPADDIIANLRKRIPQGSLESQELSLMTMASTQKASRLVEVRFVERTFPFYGNIQLNKKGIVGPGAAAALDETHDIWIYPELRSQLGVDIGDNLKIGNVNYRIADLVDDDPTTSGMGFVLAPRIYADYATAEATGLMQLGSRIQYLWRYKLPTSTDSDQLEAAIRKQIPDNSLRIRSHHNATEELGRLQNYLNDYLGLVALAALFLATVGTAYLLRGHLTATIKDFGILLSLGATPKLPAVVFAIQAMLLGFAGSLLAAITSRLILPQLASLMEPITGKIEIAPLSTDSILLATTMAVAGGVLMALPLMIRLMTLRPSFLFQEASAPTIKLTWQHGFYYVPALVVWWIAAIVQARSVRNGSIFAAAFLGSALLLAAWGAIKLRLLTKVLPHLKLPWKIRLALTQMARSPLAAMSSFIALALGATLLNVIPQIRNSVAKEIERPDSSIPQFFMFDIQDEQIEGLNQFFTKRNVRLSEPSAMVRARLDLINGEPADKRKLNLEGERDQEQRENLQTRMQNLSFREHLSSSETLIAGEFVTSRWNGEGTPAISIEQDFAKRLGLNMGDVMTFDITGVAIEGKITSIRRVRWTSFQPNFFILLQPGTLDDAPKTWVASASGVADDQREQIQSDIVTFGSNISVIDVKAAVRRMLVLVDQISTAIGFVAILALLAGLGVLFAIASHQARERRLSFALLKTLGATIREAAVTSLWEYGLIATAAVFLGTLLSVGVSWIISTYVFKAPWQGSFTTPALTAIILSPTAVGITWLAVHRALSIRVAELLR